MNRRPDRNTVAAAVATAAAAIAATVVAMFVLCALPNAARAAEPGGTAQRPSAPKHAAKPLARPLVLSAQRIVGRSEGPRVLFVHAEPKLALELAPARPSYLRDDFTAALASPVFLRVRAFEPLADSLKGGTP